MLKTFSLSAGLVVAPLLSLAQEPAPKSPAGAEHASAAQAPDPELVAARRKLVVLRARYGENHPDVQKQLRYIADLRKGGQAAATAKAQPPAASPLEAAKQELAALRERYTDEHPLVKNQIRKIAELEKP